MGAGLWKALAERLKARDDLDPHLAAVVDRLDRTAPAASLERQLVEEMTFALRRSTDKVDAALAALARIARQVAAAVTSAERDERIAAFNGERKRALEAYRDLLIHREALGFRRHDEIARSYPIPPPIPPRIPPQGPALPRS
jgi:hypothetical protein